jgi:ribose 5-phosphate isomerase RpiB
MSLRTVSEPVAFEIMDAWFNTSFGGEEDARNVALVAALENRYCRGQQ